MLVHCCVEKLNELRNTLRQHFCTKATRRLFFSTAILMAAHYRITLAIVKYVTYRSKKF